MAPKGQRKGNFPMANAAGTLFDLKGKTALITGSTRASAKPSPNNSPAMARE